MTKRIGVVFPGYGEQFVGMGKDIYDEFRVVQEFFEQASVALDTNCVKLMFASSDKELSSVRYAYLAIFLFESSLYELLWQKGLRPDFLAGYGIGEYSACFASRSLSFVDGLYFLNKYSQFYQKFLQDKDYTVLKTTRDFTLESIQELIDKFSTDNSSGCIAAHNTQQGFYVSGSIEVVQKIQEYCKDHVIRKVKEIGVEYGLHCGLMDPIVDQLKLYYHKIQFAPLKVPVITNVDGVYVTTSDALQSAVVRRINNKIEWYEVSKGFEGCDVIISVGPGKQLIEWFQEMYPDKEYHSISSLKDIEKIQNLLSSQEVDDQGVEKKDKTEKSLHDADLVNDRASDYENNNDE